MKKTVMFCFILGLVLTGFCQKQKSEFVLNDRMYQVFTQAEIDQMYANDFAKLFCLNYKMTNFAKVAGKSVEGANVLGYIEQYAKTGVRVNEAEMIRTGAINPFDYDLPQDDTKVNAIRLHTPGYYVLVLPKFRYEEEERANLQQYVY